MFDFHTGRSRYRMNVGCSVPEGKRIDVHGSFVSYFQASRDSPVTALSSDILIQRVPRNPLDVVRMLSESEYTFSSGSLPDGSRVIGGPSNEPFTIRGPCKIVNMFGGHSLNVSGRTKANSLKHSLQSPMLFVRDLIRLFSKGHDGFVRRYPQDDVAVCRRKESA